MIVHRILIILVILSLDSAADARSPSPPADGRAIGYGAQARGGVVPCHFSTEASLRACLGRGGADAIADVAFTVKPRAGRLEIAADTTLDGRGLLTVAPSGFGLDIHVSNVIVRNTTFRGPGPTRTLYPAVYPGANCTTPRLPKELFGCAVPIKMRGAAERLWIDHNTFVDCGNACISGWDNGDGTGRPDMITVSNNVFRDSFFALGFGVNERVVALPSPGHITLYGNLFDHIFRRAPRAAGGYQIHVFNNYWVNWGGGTYPGARIAACNGGFGPSVTGRGEILMEANVAERGLCGELVDNQSYNPADGVARGFGRVRAVGNLGLRGATVTGKDRVDFSPSYPYTLLPVGEVKTAVLANAGATQRQ